MSSAKRFAMISAVALACAGPTMGRTIEKGTVEVAGGSDVFFQNRQADFGDSYELSAALAAGYFALNNLELGLSLGVLSGEHDKDSDTLGYEYTAYHVGPFVAYHFPIAESLSLYTGLSVLTRFSERDYNEGSSSDADGLDYGIRLGLEYFLNTHVALLTSVRASHTDWDIDDYDGHSIDDNETRISASAAIEIFF